MNKLIFRKFSLDIVNFFLIASFSITFIIWIIQAVNFLDLVSDDGHSLNIYFYYVSLNLPKIFSKTISFVFFISIFYVINKYINSNELIVFWSNGSFSCVWQLRLAMADTIISNYLCFNKLLHICNKYL